MPHYADGTPACPGDIVQGRGYNIKDEAGKPLEIVGVMLGIAPDCAACNVQVAVLSELSRKLSTDTCDDARFYSPGPGVVVGHDASAKGARAVRLALEYGQADHFRKIGVVPRLPKDVQAP